MPRLPAATARYPLGMERGRQYVFGYGSLLEGAHEPEAEPAELAGYRRTWNVAMDNAQTIPGYKYYVDPATGARPQRFVTFLNVVPESGAHVNGVLIPVTEARLGRLDERERNYDRVEISSRLSRAVNGRAWVYTGTEAAVRRFETGRRTGRAVVPLDYWRRVLEDFAAAGPEALQAFWRLTDAPSCPVIDLRRVDVPGGEQPPPDQPSPDLQTQAGRAGYAA